MADSMFHQPVMGRRAFVGGTLAASSMAFLAACGKKGGDASGSESGSTLNFYINNPVCIDPYNVQEDQGTQVEYQLFDALTSYDAEKGEIDRPRRAVGGRDANAFGRQSRFSSH